MRPLSSEAVLAAFDAIDLPSVVTPDLTYAAWDDLDFLSWRHPDGGLAYVVIPLPERPVGLVIRLSHTRGRTMCDLCYGMDRDAGTMMVMVDNWARPRTAHGLCICSDFECSAGARGLKYMYRMGETITAGRRVERLQRNVELFARSITGLTGAKRSAS